MTNATRIIIFAKYPQAGNVKTRLIPELGADRAALLALQLLNHAVHEALKTNLEVELCVSPNHDHPCWEALDICHNSRLIWSNQSSGDLGERMATAVRNNLISQPNRHVILIGTDCPALDQDKLLQAAEQLNFHDSVLTPALDGGYVLMGVKAYSITLFEGIEWSTSTVYKSTKNKIQQLGWSCYHFPQEADIDTSADLHYLPATWIY
ncbi:TIGR04282 family arsenosugar biosynthesis glycosyltransferase [Acinetobacter portensis]|uniref:TIGR04282 family arsenosugar biosynthesis glycosyltransferase n=1 Tax=Acinetobacter portensis TaxID=1839785 RepID=A0ABY4K1H1_9GAMM|nr:TIGR04282 family arsenosugar biosynthesis glycosyltransferase [Acinetobacter portensis]MCK7609874.1 TIGR04282 family arsenosugar biosynthesis glycosyltransferase [Acinetobacter portensis]MCK7640649.1 TIGR04282 family arsenosugar biosynthesis glycosyltransferase [Acinetobacter portensis]UPO24830.1 TIGR04282 family arsenosugar biosynthesis glycosyltransferase [Acinetobacter portensis]